MTMKIKLAVRNPSKVELLINQWVSLWKIKGCRLELVLIGTLLCVLSPHILTHPHLL